MTFDVAPTASEVAEISSWWGSGWTLPAPMTVSEWADQHRIIPKGAGGKPGRWSTDFNPPLREIQDCLSTTSPVIETSFMKSTQVGATEILINSVFYRIEHAPSAQMVVQPTGSSANIWSTQRFRKAAQVMDVIKAILPAERGGDGSNTAKLKEYPGGLLLVAAAASSSGVRQAPIQVLHEDELDEYPGDLNEQGRADKAAEERTASFASRKKIYRASTPTVDGASKIQAAFYEGDQRHFHVPCPHCGFMQPLHIDNLTDDGKFMCLSRAPMTDPQSAAGVRDGGCGAIIDAHHKTAMIAAGQWVPRFPDRAKRSYHLWKAYTPHGLGDTWQQIADMRAAASKDAALLVTYTNLWLGLPYAGLSQKIETEELEKRAEKWLRRTIPRGCLLLTGSVDVQHNRFAVMILGFGRNEQMFFIDWVELPGDPTRQEDWEAVHEFIQQPIINSCGVAMRPESTGFDSGNWTHETYRFVRSHPGYGYFALKGEKQGNKPVISRAAKMDVNYRGSVVKAGVQLWMVGGDTAKTTLFQRLLGDADAQPEHRRMHFPADMPPEFYKQWGGERFDIEANRWVPVQGIRNEVIDNTVYAFAAGVREPIRVHLKRDSDWAALETKIEPPTDDLFAARPVAVEAPQPVRKATTATAVAEKLAGAPVVPVVERARPAVEIADDSDDSDDEIDTRRSSGSNRGWGR